jgi:hypothetical protein
VPFEPKIDARALDRLAARFAAAGAKGPQEIQRAVTSVRRATGTESRRAVSASYNLPQRYIGTVQTIKPAGPLGFTISGRNKPIPATAYGGRALARGGVAVAFARGRRIVIEDAFKGAAPQGGDKLWRRTGQAKTRPTKGRYAGAKFLREPIDVLTGPSAADHLNNSTVRARLDGFFVRRLNNEVNRRLARLLARRGA